MPAGWTIALTLLAQSATGAAQQPPPALPPTAAPAPAPASDPAPLITPAKTSDRECTAQTQGPNANEIVICAPRPLGYRISPDLLQAWRDKKRGITGAPKNPHETFADHSCANVGPMGCRGGPMISLTSAALVAAQIAGRLAKGEEIGSIFVTQPQGGNEYQLYQAAKQRRESKEAQDAAKTKIAAELAAKAAGKSSGALASPAPVTPAPTPSSSKSPPG